jgi:hypothetical protein
MEGMVQIIKDNGNRIQSQMEEKVESITQDLEIFQTDVNRTHSEMSLQMQNLYTQIQEVVNNEGERDILRFNQFVRALKNIQNQQINEFHNMNVNDDEIIEETENSQLESDSDHDKNESPTPDQENKVPNQNP